MNLSARWNGATARQRLLIGFVLAEIYALLDSPFFWGPNAWSGSSLWKTFSAPMSFFGLLVPRVLFYGVLGVLIALAYNYAKTYCYGVLGAWVVAVVTGPPAPSIRRRPV
jgi:hypothetical protein